MFIIPNRQNIKIRMKKNLWLAPLTPSFALTEVMWGAQDQIVSLFAQARRARRYLKMGQYDNQTRHSY
jgi:hypothetical protein